jgi:peptidoglycan/xylan/chitin deacetylase (PgdA/CDA1 family)
VSFALPRRRERTAAEKQRRKWFRQTVLGVITLLLTPIPIIFYMAHTSDGYLMYLKARYSLDAPSTPQLPADQMAVATADRKAPNYGVPVLVYHGIGQATTDTADAKYVISRTHFAQQMRALHAAGYHAITTAQLAEYLKTANASLMPQRPVLITFDDGREDAMLQADPILKATGMKATMFVIGADPGSNSFYYADWGALSSYASDGRWELGNHTDQLHHIHDVNGVPQSDLVTVEPGETIAQYKQRIADDIGRDESLIDQNSPDHAIAFAYPYGDWGQQAPPGVAKALNQVLASKFQLAFDQDGESGWRPALSGDDAMHIHRLQAMDWTGAQLIERLRAAMKLAHTTYEQRGLDVNYTNTELVAAAAAYRCPPITAAPVSSAPAVPGDKQIALTFDGGPSPYTAQVLDVLRTHNDKATFFVNGAQLSGENRLLVRMVLAGDEIGNGSWDGTSLATADDQTVRSSISRAQAAIRAAVPITPCFTRPPYGLDRPRYARIAASLDLGTALWSIDPSDFRGDGPGVIARRVLAAAKPGGIVVLHDGGGPRWATVQALPHILSELRSKGYRFVTVSQLLASRAG